MSDQFLAEIRIFGFNFAPTGWAQCSGQLMSISQNTALFALLGTNYGGDGRVTFGLPNLNGNVPIHVGNNQPGPGLSVYQLGEVGGVDSVTLLTTEMASHSHSFAAANSNATTNNPFGTIIAKGNYSFQGNSGAVATYTTAAPDTQMNVQTIGLNGGNLPHNNIMPSLTLIYCIALQGIFPQRP